ncbi:hypothetical protein BDN71DRAFT_1433439 [Pleurotus eryngii]|uniref:SAM domain-containing protein n=1 Tax=Pleurotus eryngii TaxID=5323 RepID=A0A9P6DCV0_PLEER|nr:hypothetical protein BDN71DRAFT_1433439 [Pleurotus eryngii]
MPGAAQAKVKKKSVEFIMDSDDLLLLPPMEAMQKLPDTPDTQAEETDEANEADDQITPSSPPPRPTQKRKRSEAIPDEEPDTIITYQLKIAPKSEINKYPAKRANQGAVLHLKRSVPWDTVKAQFLAKISKVLNPRKERFADYQVQYAIPRVSPDPTDLTTAEDYADFQTSVPLKEKVTRVSDKENDLEAGDDSDSSSGLASSDGGHKPKKRRQKKKKQEKRKDLKDSPLENHVIASIKQLRERWQCSQCSGSAHCFWSNDHPNHLPLTNQLLRTWALALLSNDPFIATVKTPPNHADFNALPSRVVGGRTPLQERRARSASSANKSEPPAFHLHLPPSLNVMGGPPPTPTPTALLASLTSTNLLERGQLGQSMTVAEFCTTFDLSEQIRALLEDNGYLRTKTFSHITLAELKDMGFKSGQVASFREALKEWVATPTG